MIKLTAVGEWRQDCDGDWCAVFTDDVPGPIEPCCCCGDISGICPDALLDNVTVSHNGIEEECPVYDYEMHEAKLGGYLCHECYDGGER